MWSKILTVINTLLLLTIIGLAGLGFQQYNLVQQQNTLQSKQFSQEITNLKQFQTEILENPIFSADISPSDTLVIKDDRIMGYVELTGYLITEEQPLINTNEPEQVAVIAFKNPTDETLIEFIELQVELESKLYKLEDTTYYMPIGCIANNMINSTNLQVNTNILSQLKESSQEAPLNLRLIFNGETNSVEVCDGKITQLQIIN